MKGARKDLAIAIGVMSGTSMDGIDVALIASDGETQVETGPAATFPYPETLSRRLRVVVASQVEAEAPQPELERAVTDAHVAAVEAFLTRFAVERDAAVARQHLHLAARAVAEIGEQAVEPDRRGLAHLYAWKIL